MSFLNDKNELTGYDIEVGRFIANHLGVKLDLVRLDWKGILPGLQTGRFDVVVGAISGGMDGEISAKVSLHLHDELDLDGHVGRQATVGDH